MIQELTQQQESKLQSLSQIVHLERGWIQKDNLQKQRRIVQEPHLDIKRKLKAWKEKGEDIFDINRDEGLPIKEHNLPIGRRRRSPCFLSLSSHRAHQ